MEIVVWVCSICGADSASKTFYKGVSSRCAECHREKVKSNRAAKAEYYREYDAKRFKEDPKVRLRHKRYQKTEAGKRSMALARAKFVAQNPEKRAAHVILGNAVRDGKVIKPTSCSACGNEVASRRLHAHHHDYASPLSVVWLCADCHVKEHRA